MKDYLCRYYDYITGKEEYDKLYKYNIIYCVELVNSYDSRQIRREHFVTKKLAQNYIDRLSSTTRDTKWISMKEIKVKQYD